MISEFHSAHLFLKKGDVLLLRNMVCMMSAVISLLETYHFKLGMYISDEVIRFYDTPVSIVS